MRDKVRLIQLISEAISVAEDIAHTSSSIDQSWIVPDIEATANQLRQIINQVNADTLSPSRGAGLGIARALSEWAPKQLYDAGKKVEDYYRQHWK